MPRPGCNRASPARCTPPPLPPPLAWCSSLDIKGCERRDCDEGSANSCSGCWIETVVAASQARRHQLSMNEDHGSRINAEVSRTMLPKSRKSHNYHSQHYVIAADNVSDIRIHWHCCGLSLANLKLCGCSATAARLVHTCLLRGVQAISLISISVLHVGRRAENDFAAASIPCRMYHAPAS
jgi:hypothetical protein